ncbi:MAG: PHP domain-containing protein [Candidatus Latescibacterota bacterium]|nr:MAG: PHP domain-containing protein [Candidatus Latescibacterota bacterium]
MRLSLIHADLHTHSDYSDGSIPPPELLLRAGYAGLAAIALTDHDTVDGVEPMRGAAPEGAPEVIAGLELSCMDGDDEIHILGHWVDPDYPPLRTELARIRGMRVRRAESILDRLRAHRIVLDLEDVMGLTRNGLVGRPHIAEAIVRRGLVPDLETVYRKYLGDGRPAAVPKRSLSPADGVRLIRRAGGIASVAHPGVGAIRNLLPPLAASGLAGLEVWHPKHSSRDVERFTALAEQLGLVPTGGSDYHGLDSGATILGHYGLTEDRFERYRAAAGRG